MAASKVILVDPDDNVVGEEEKLRAHALGVLHRAVSVFVADPAGHLILQQRHAGKYHSGGLWSNTACTHPQPGESVAEAAARCLSEEMGLSAVLQPAFRFSYRASVSREMVEHEYDHVFVGEVAAVPRPSPQEVQAWGVVAPNVITMEMAAIPEKFTPWFRIAFPLYQRWSDQGAERGTNPYFESP
jgi:isopentenyl-diphosphate delta-isomerase